MCLSLSLFENELVKLISHYLHLSLGFPSSKQSTYSISIMFIVTVAEPKIREYFFLQRLYSNFRVTKNDEEIIIGY